MLWQSTFDAGVIIPVIARYDNACFYVAKMTPTDAAKRSLPPPLIDSLRDAQCDTDPACHAGVAPPVKMTLDITDRICRLRSEDRMSLLNSVRVMAKRPLRQGALRMRRGLRLLRDYLPDTDCSGCRAGSALRLGAMGVPWLGPALGVHRPVAG